MTEDLPDHDLALELQRAQDYEDQAADIRKNVRCELMSRYVVRLCTVLLSHNESPMMVLSSDELQLIAEARALAMKDQP